MREGGVGRVRVGATGVRRAAFGRVRAHLGRGRRGLGVQDGASTTTPVAEVREEGVDGEGVVVGPAPRESPAGTASAAAVLGGRRPTFAQWPLRSGLWCPLLPARIGEVTHHLPSSAAKVHRSPADTPGAQDQGLGQHREGVLGGSEGEPVRERCSPARLRLRGHNELLAAPTCAAPTQAAQLGRHGSVNSPPMSWEKKRSAWRTRWEASSEEAIVSLEGVDLAENEEGAPVSVTFRLGLHVLVGLGLQRM